MQKNKHCTLQDALEAIVGDDSEFEECDNSSGEDPDDPLYNPNSQDRESDESSECGDSDSSESSTSDDVPQPNMNSGQQNTSVLEKKQETVQGQKQGTKEGTVQGKKQFSWRKKPFETPECTFKGPHMTPPDNLS